MLKDTVGILGEDNEKRSVRFLSILIISSLVVRYSLMFFNHPWDITTFHNLFINLANGVNPYDVFIFRTHQGRSLVHGWSRYYPYYAYPPGLIYLYTPISDVWAWGQQVPPATYLYPGMWELPPAGTADLWFLFLYKTPIFLADIGVGLLLYKMAGKKSASLYLFNPLVILVSASWMFDAIPIFFLVLSIFLVQTERPILAGLSLGIGAVFKFFPAFAGPPIALWYLNRRDPSVYKFSLAGALSFFMLIIPYSSGFLFSLQFMSGRVGGGLTLHSLVYWISINTEMPVLWLQTELSPEIGSLTLVAGLMLTYLYIYKNNLNLYSSIAVGMIGFLISTKIINEQYATWVIPALILVLSTSGWSIKKRILYKLMYSIPVAYAIFNVPIYNFFGSLYASVGNPLISNIQYPDQLRSTILVIFALMFFVTLFSTFFEYSETKDMRVKL